MGPVLSAMSGIKNRTDLNVLHSRDRSGTTSGTEDDPERIIQIRGQDFFRKNMGIGVLSAVPASPPQAAASVAIASQEDSDACVLRRAV